MEKLYAGVVLILIQCILGMGCSPSKKFVNFKPKYFNEYRNSRYDSEPLAKVEILEGLPKQDYIIVGEVKVSSSDLTYEEMIWDVYDKIREVEGDGLMKLEYGEEKKRLYSKRGSGSVVGHATKGAGSTADLAGSAHDDEYFGQYIVRTVTGDVFIYRKNMRAVE